MQIVVKTGDILDEAVDIIVSTPNPYLNMSGGINGAILLRGGEELQAELHEYLRVTKRRWLDAGEVVTTGPGPLAVRKIIHAVAISRAYESSREIVKRTVIAVLDEAVRLAAKSVAIPALATGYGQLSKREFAFGLRDGLKERENFPGELRMVLRYEEDAELVRSVLEEQSR